MATKTKTTVEEIAMEEVTEETVAEKVAEETVAEKVVDAWDEEVEVRIPKTDNGDSNSAIASVNGRVFQIKRGVNVKVPKPIAEVIENSYRMQNEADEFAEAKVSE